MASPWWFFRLPLSIRCSHIPLIRFPYDRKTFLLVSLVAMSYQQSHDMYHDNPSARSPGSQRHQQPLHRQPSRQFDAYGPMPVNIYDDPMARYDTARLKRLNPSLHSNSYAYDLGGSQTWNPNGFANPQTLGGIRSASASMKATSRGGRAGLPTVRDL